MQTQLCQSSNSSDRRFKKETSVAVRLKPLEISKDPIPIVASGVTASKAELNLSFKIGGIIENLNVEEGKRVRKGQLLAKIRTTEIDAQVLKAKNGVIKAERDVDRIQKLYQDSAATLEQVQNLTTVLDLARSDLEIAEFNQNYAKIVAPVSGRVLRKFVEANELINPGTPVFRVATNQGKGYVINIGVSDKDVVRIRLNDPAEIQFDPYPNEVFKAYVSKIAEAADPQTGAFEVELTIQSAGKVFRNGFVGKVKVYPSQQYEYYKIDMAALVEGQENTVNLFVPDANQRTAKKVTVNPLYIGPDYLLVSPKSLEGNQWVITEGAPYLTDGMAIRAEQ